MKKIYLKTKRIVMVLAVTLACLLTLSQCSSLAKMFSYQTTFNNYGYHFASKATNGQMLCYIFLNKEEVGCITPDNYYDTETKTVEKYNLTGDVIIPKTVSDGENTYTVTALWPILKHHPEAKPEWTYSSSIIRDKGWGASCSINNLVIPETVKIISVDDKFKANNIIIYGPKNAESFSQVNKIIVTNSQIAAFCDKGDNIGVPYSFFSGRIASILRAKALIHVPNGCFVKGQEYRYRTTNNVIENLNTNNVVENYSDYDIYAEGHSLEEYLVLAQSEIEQKELMEQKEKHHPSDFAVRYNNEVIMFFKITDMENGNVELRYYNKPVDTLIVPSHVNYRNNKYTVISATTKNNTHLVVFPETCKTINSYCPRGEIICYASDFQFPSEKEIDGLILHVPHGCVEKYKHLAGDGCLEIVDNYSIYQEGHSVKEYINMSRSAVDKAVAIRKKEKEDARLAAEKARLQKEKQEEAEWNAYIKDLNKKYGTKYVDALFDDGKIIIGMPMDLFDIGLQDGLFEHPRINYVELESQSSHGTCFRMYAFSLNDFHSIFVGWVYFDSKNRVSKVVY